MTKRWLTYLIIALIALQSASGITDVHQTHQSGTEHLTFDDGHQHPAADQPTIFDTADNSSTINDLGCNHCCHCHGHFTSVLSAGSVGVYFRKSSTKVPTGTEGSIQKIISPLLRPPIA